MNDTDKDDDEARAFAAAVFAPDKTPDKTPDKPDTDETRHPTGLFATEGDLPMFGMSSAAEARAVMAATVKAGAKPPKPVADAYARAERISEAAARLYPGEGAVTRAVVHALDAGRDPAADPTVMRAVVATQIGDGIARQVADLVADDVQAACTANLSQLIAAWRIPFDKAAATLAAASARIGDHPLEDIDTIMRKAGDIAAVWAAARDAAAVVDTLAGGWVMLASLTRFAPIDPRYTLLRYADPTPDQWPDVAHLKLKSWDAVRHGIPLGLADAATYRRRVRAVEEHQRARQARAEAEGRAAASGKRPTTPALQ